LSVIPIAILKTGLVTAVGLNAPASCAAIRAKISNPTETRFSDSSGNWIVAHEVPLEQPWRGRAKLARMAAMAIEECMEDVPGEEWSAVPLLLCVAESDRPGRLDGLEDRLLGEIQQQLGVEFAAQSRVLSEGRVGVGTALGHARVLLERSDAQSVVIAAADSLLSWPTLQAYERDSRLLSSGNSNGFMPGEGAGALLVARRPRASGTLWISGLGFARESSTISSEEPVRADGLVAAIRRSLAEAGCSLDELDFRITDLSGEQYYFREAALALSRVLRSRKEEFDLWHPAECIGESGALAGVAALVVAETASRKGYGAGPGILCHAANDGGERMAAVARYAVS
jgi:3-oxoacyl-[acyl-carrier-protein] synthase I